MDKNNRPALGFLLLGIAAIGRALLGVQDTSSTAEVTLTVLAGLGAALLGARCRLGLAAYCGQFVMEVLLCSMEGGGWLRPVLRAADLWLVLAGAWVTLTAAEQVRNDEIYTAKHRRLRPILTVLLAVQTVLLFAQTALPDLIPLGVAGAGVFVLFSLGLIWYGTRMLSAYNVLRVKKTKRIL